MRTVADPRALDALTARIGRVTPTTPARWGRMTAHQMLLHLTDAAEHIGAGRPLRALPRRPSRLVKWVALYAPVPWPRGIEVGADPAAVPVAAARFDQDRERAIASLAAFARSMPGTFTPVHSLFGPMSHGEWLRWAWRHTDHHLRQFGV